MQRKFEAVNGGVDMRRTDAQSSSYIDIEKQKRAWCKSEWDGSSQCATSEEIGSFAQTLYALTKGHPESGHLC